MSIASRQGPALIAVAVVAGNQHQHSSDKRLIAASNEREGKRMPTLFFLVERFAKRQRLEDRRKARGQPDSNRLGRAPGRRYRRMRN
jgi:hypothetical protein